MVFIWFLYGIYIGGRTNQGRREIQGIKDYSITIIHQIVYNNVNSTNSFMANSKLFLTDKKCSQSTKGATI